MKNDKIFSVIANPPRKKLESGQIWGVHQIEHQKIRFRLAMAKLRNADLPVSEHSQNSKKSKDMKNNKFWKINLF